MKKLYFVFLFVLCISFAHSQSETENRFTFSSSYMGAFTGRGDMLGTAYNLQFRKIAWKDIGIVLSYENANFSGALHDFSSYTKNQLNPYVDFGAETPGHTDYARSNALYFGVFHQQKYNRNRFLISLSAGIERYHFTYVSSIAELEEGLEIQNRYVSGWDVSYALSLDYLYDYSDCASFGIGFNYRTGNISLGPAIYLHF